MCPYKHTHICTYSLKKLVPYAHMHVQTHVKWTHLYRCRNWFHLCMYSFLTLVHYVTMVCFNPRVFEELNYWRTDGRTWKCGSSSSAGPVHPHSPCHLSGEMPVTFPALHVRDTCFPVQPWAGLTDTTQWHTHFAEAEVDIWATETEVKHRSIWVLGVMWLISQQAHTVNEMCWM